MRIFKKVKKDSNCCNVQLEEVKPVKKKPLSTCCDFNLEEVKIDKKNKPQGGCC